MSGTLRHGQVQVCDGRLVSERGSPVTLRGMSFFWSQWGGQFYSDEWVRVLKTEWRVDLVRAALGLEPDGYLANPAQELAKIEAVVDAAIRHGLYVIVDWHGHTANTEAATSFFAAMASQYAGYPNLIWETWNEPLADDDWATSIKPHHCAVIDAIRAKGNMNLVICGTGSHCRDVDVAAADPIDAENVAYGLHFYAGSHRQGLRDRVERALALGACVFTSEYGLGEANGDGILDAQEALRWWAFLEKHGISHVNWSLFDKQETCAALKPRRGRLWGRDPYVLSASGKLVRNHLRTAARRSDPMRGGRTAVPAIEVRSRFLMHSPQASEDV